MSVCARCSTGRRRTAGGFAVLWHSEQYDSALLPGWDRLYRRFIEEVQRAGRRLRAGRGPRRGGARVAVVSARMQIYRAGAGRIGSSALFLGLVLAAPALLGSRAALARRGAGARASARRGRRLRAPPAGRDLRARDGPPGTPSASRSRRRSRGASPRSPARSRSRSRSTGRSRRRSGCSPASRPSALVPALLRAPRRLRAERAQDRWPASPSAGSVFAGAVWWTANTI